jgi:hypothetical protein
MSISLLDKAKAQGCVSTERVGHGDTFQLQVFSHVLRGGVFFGLDDDLTDNSPNALAVVASSRESILKLDQV